jgi:hypothetical protein
MFIFIYKKFYCEIWIRPVRSAPTLACTAQDWIQVIANHAHFTLIQEGAKKPRNISQTLQ